MSVKLMALVWDRYPQGGGELNLALKLADHAHDDGTHIFPGVDMLAQRTRQSKRAVQYQLRRMESIGWLQTVAYPKGGRGKSREYRISREWINGAELAPFRNDKKLSTKGAKTASFENGKGANGDKKGCNPERERVQSEAQNHATAVAPQQSVTVIEPSVNRHGAMDRALVDNSNETTTDDDLNAHQTQKPQTSENDAGASGGARDDSAPADDSASGVAARDDGVSITFEWLKSAGVKVEPESPLIAGWNKAGVTRQQIELGVEKCKPYKLNGVPAAYLAPAIEEMLNPPERAAKRISVGTDEASVKAAARAIGLDQGRQGESLPEYRRRVLEAMDKGKRAAA
ncbi:hypothetical protein WN982_00375 [Paraburkholderia sp. IMGN_8]|uniref:hypothetical protein n=1 Tax=Paraburkholderia sp. IMGN_8 TaxID=3136564 RepID=UPI0031018F55